MGGFEEHEHDNFEEEEFNFDVGADNKKVQYYL